jgi:carbamoyl-phosphate synthase large subunit
MEHATPAIWGAGAGRRRVRILFTCAGRRIELMTAFLRAARALRLEARLHSADIENAVAAACLADQAHQVPPARSSDYIPTLLEITRRHRIDLVVPLLDVELPKLARAREDFARQGCHVLISSPRVVSICRDKLATFAFLTGHGIDTPRTWTADEIMRRTRHRYPYFLKPRKGSASKKNFTLRNRADLAALVPYVPDAIVQEFARGEEYTLDVYTGTDGVPRCVVPRLRVEVRGGEVTKARTVHHDEIIRTGVRVAEALGDCVGLITIQLILGSDGRIRVIEINPRFGGGVPLAIQAGADFPRWLLMEWLGRRPRIRLAHFKPDVLMLRYHQAYFCHGGRCRKGPPCPR